MLKLSFFIDEMIDDVCLLLDQHVKLDLAKTTIFIGSHITPIGHTILIPNQPVTALSP